MLALACCLACDVDNDGHGDSNDDDADENSVSDDDDEDNDEHPASPVMRAFQSIMRVSSNLRKTEEEMLRRKSAAMPASSLPTRACLLRGIADSVDALSL